MRRRVAALLIGAMLLMVPVGGNAQTIRLDPSKFDLTPSHVFSLWVNINNCILAVAREMFEDRAFHVRLRRLSPVVTSGKKPSDVLVGVLALRGQVDMIRLAKGLRPSARFQAESAEITPSIVFLTSGDVLDGLADWYVRHAGREKLVGRFYVRRGFTDKTPSDVFGLVDLARRRLKLIREKLRS